MAGPGNLPELIPRQDTKGERPAKQEQLGFVELFRLNLIETIVPIGEYRPKSARRPEAQERQTGAGARTLTGI
jgi:hypothetical protein